MCSARRALVVLLACAGGVEGATLTSARATLEIRPDGACDVRIAFVVRADAASIADHRLATTDAAAVDDVAVRGAGTGDVRRAGRTLVVPVAIGPGETSYEARYLVRQAPGAGRCALLVPDVPADGIARPVEIEVTLPESATRLPGDFPAFAWRDNRGVVTLGHLPVFAAAPHAGRGADVGWRRSIDVRRAMDGAAVVILIGATGAWMALRRRKP